MFMFFRKVRALRKVNMVFLFIITVMVSLLSIGYALLSQEVMITGDVSYVIAEDILYNAVRREATSGGLALEYTGSHQDSMSGLGNKGIYYYYATSDAEGTAIQNKNNVIFANKCWQIIRTTDTGGVKMIYNGEAVNHQCLNNRGTHIGYASIAAKKLSGGTYYYGTDYEFDASTNKFRLTGTTQSAKWSASVGPGLVGLYTCAATSATATCATLWYVESYATSANGNCIAINSSSSYSQLGTLQYNMDASALAHSGYMYNVVNGLTSKTLASTNYKYGASYSYDESTGYTLDADDTVTFKGSAAANIALLDTHHYTCWNTGGNCASISYIFYNSGSVLYYINLSGGETVSDTIENMLGGTNLNTTNSVLKTAIDIWYQKYLADYSEYIEDTVYCNDRSIRMNSGLPVLGGFDPVSGSLASYLEFKNHDVVDDLSCSSLLDSFSVTNTSAPLTYKVGLPTAAEMNLYNNNNARISTTGYWVGSPYDYRETGVFMKSVDATGALTGSLATTSLGVRPVISLAYGARYLSGDGSMANPYNIDTYTLTYDSNGGSVCTPGTKVQGTLPHPWGTLCEPVRENYIFLGWNTEQNGTGATITSGTIVSSDLTVYAQWQAVGPVWDYPYVTGGKVTKFIAPETAKYKIEVWGAQGVGGSNGAYVYGDIYLIQGTELYVYPGGRESWNGGGGSSAGRYGGDGSDVRLVEGNLYSRIIVAAGGGGQSSGGTTQCSYPGDNVCGRGTPGIGGLFQGDASTYAYHKTCWGEFGTDGCLAKRATAAGGGTQLAGGAGRGDGAFGVGGTGSTASSANPGGGGGGYYGGGSGRISTGSSEGHTVTAVNGGGGGSSYISGALGYVAITADGNTRPRFATDGTTQCTEEIAAEDVKCSVHYSGYVFSNTGGEAGVREGDGEITITQLQPVSSGEGFTVTINSTDTSMGTVTPTTQNVVDGGTAVAIALANTDYEYASNTCGGEISGNTLTIQNVRMDIECTVSFVYATTFVYTGTVQTYTIPVDGIYKIELWGSEGVGGGDGAYVSGEVSLLANEVLYFYVGGKETWNGGGNAADGRYGGDATDVRLVQDNLYSRIMVAAGGGGGASGGTTQCHYPGSNVCGRGTPGMGGLIEGASATYAYHKYCVQHSDDSWDCSNEKVGGGTGGTQTAGGVGKGNGDFGIGGYGAAAYSANPGGGGGGYFGGGSGKIGRNTRLTTITSVSGGGGGSSYISGVSGYVAIAANGDSTPRLSSDGVTPCDEVLSLTDSICSVHYSGKIFTNATEIAGSRTGEGQARISLVS